MNVFLENEHIRVGIKSAGAELFSVLHKQNKLEYMWRGDPAVWGKTSPVLFPIVGTLRDNTYRFRGNTYTLPRHGFARDQDFEVVSTTGNSALFAIHDTAESLLKYPFHFRLLIEYTIHDDTLEVGYRVENRGGDEMYFSLGAHPAFAVPLIAGTSYQEYYLEFNETENAPRWPINAAGLIEGIATPLLDGTNRLPLRRALFHQDAVVLKNLKSTRVSLKHTAVQHGLDFFFDGFPFLGIWAAKNADFLCIEPWCGIADSVVHDQELTRKEGIEKLAAGAQWNRKWKVHFY